MKILFNKNKNRKFARRAFYSMNRAAKRMDREMGKAIMGQVSQPSGFRVLLGNILFVLIILSLGYIFIFNPSIGQPFLNRLIEQAKNIGEQINNVIQGGVLNEIPTIDVNENGISIN